MSTAVTVSAPPATPYGATLALVVSVTDSGPSPAVPTPGASVTVEESSGEDWVTLATASTGADGTADVPLPVLPAGDHQLRAEVAASDTTTEADSDAVTVTVTPATTSITLSAPEQIRSETTASLGIALTSTTAPAGSLAGQPLTLTAVVDGVTTTHSLTTDADGAATVAIPVWRSATWSVGYAGSADLAAATPVSATTGTTGLIGVAVQDPRAPRPKVQYPVGPPPVGTGANAGVSVVPHDVWRAMQGRTYWWGCAVGGWRDIRLVTVNYWGFDGYRYRGEIVVSDKVAARVARAFTHLYWLHFRIRSMHPEDVYGRDPKGPGANDYASMAADNTSGLNCRYTVGQERHKVWSPHANGTAIDINPWENPFVSHDGVYPNAYFLRRRVRQDGVLQSATSPAVGAFTTEGFFWGGLWTGGLDSQHFQWPD